MTSTTKLFAALTLLTALCVSAHAQPSYSVDFQGPTAGANPTIEGSILVPNGVVGPPPSPTVAIPFGPTGLGLSVNAVGIVELDALSYGTDDIVLQGVPMAYQISVDEYAWGQPFMPGPSVWTESSATNPAPEAAADIYTSVAPALSAPNTPGVNVGTWDGNGGATPFASPTLNLWEPHAPTPLSLPDVGDNLDAWDNAAPQFPVYYSMDSAFPDPLETAPANSGSAQANGFLGGDVVVTTAAGGPAALYASSFLLGLNASGGDDDDLDALILLENGVPGYQPVIGPFSWVGAAGTDQLLYSVRRGSAVIGMPDAIFGAPISEGDILVPVQKSPGIWFPGIFVNAEALGLGTLRSGTPNGHIGTLWNDELDALDVHVPVPEPTSLALVALSASLLVRRRARRSA
jgi:hypothetical protein